MPLSPIKLNKLDKRLNAISEDEMEFKKINIIIDREISKSTISLPYENINNKRNDNKNRNILHDNLLLLKSAESIKNKKRTLNDIKGKFSNFSKLSAKFDKSKSLNSVNNADFATINKSNNIKKSLNNLNDNENRNHINYNNNKIRLETSSNKIPKLIDQKRMMYNAGSSSNNNVPNQLILNNKDIKLQQFYSIYQNQNDLPLISPSPSPSSNTTQSSSLSNSNTSLYYDHSISNPNSSTLPINNKIQLLKLRFNQLNQLNSNNQQHHHHQQNILSPTNNHYVKSNSIELNSKLSTPSPTVNKNIPSSSSTSMLTSILPSSYQFQRNQDTIIEECKQSLDELMKASKWSMRSNIQPVKSHDNLNLDQQQQQQQNNHLHIQLITDNNNSNSIQNSYKSSLQLKLKSNDTVISPVNEYKYIVNQTNSNNLYGSTPLIASASNTVVTSPSRIPTPLLSNYRTTTAISSNSNSVNNLSATITPTATTITSDLSILDSNRINSSIEQQQLNNEEQKTPASPFDINQNQENKFNFITKKNQKLNEQQQILNENNTTNNNNNNEVLVKTTSSNNINSKRENFNRRSETLDSILLASDTSETQVVTGLPPPGRNSLVQQQRPLSNLNTSDSMSSLKSLVSGKSANSTTTPTNAVLPPTPIVQPQGSRKATPEPSSSSSNNNGQNNNSKKKDIKEKRKRNNSWIANSFRKAFGKEKKKSFDNDEDSGNNSSSNSGSSKSNKKSSTKRVCASDDENQLRTMKSSLKRDSDSDYDENYNKIISNKLTSETKLSKRTYRSESELLDDHLDKKDNNSVIQRNNNNSSNNKKNINFNNFNAIQNYKSCSSIVTSTNSTEDSSSTNSRSQKCNCNNTNGKKLNINDEIVSDLKIKLTNAENKLTDIRLEALSSVHHVDQLKECLDKIKCEMISLRSENKVLKTYLNEIKNQNVDLRSISPSSCGVKDNFTFETEQEEVLLNKKFESLLKSINSVNNNIMNYCYSYNFLLSDENEALLRKAYVTIKCSYHDSPTEEQEQLQQESNNDCFTCKHEICIINIDSKLKWKLMDGIITYVFKRYLKLIDPLEKMGLNKNSIEKYNIGEISRYLNDSKLPNLLPFGYLVGNNCTIEIVLKDNYSHLDLLSFDTLIPKYLLEDYISQVFKHKYLAITSLKKLGKTYLMRKIAQFMSKHFNNKVEIIYYDMDDLTASLSVYNSNSTKIPNYQNDEQNIKNLLINNLYSKIINISKTNFNNQPVIILIDNFNDLFINNNKSKHSIDIIHSIFKMQTLVNFYFIVTIRNTSTSGNQDEFVIPIEFEKYFRRINLQAYQEPILSFSYRYLHKRLIKYQVLNYKSKDFNVLMEKIISWLIDIYKFVNEFIQKIGFNDRYISPYLFTDIPLNIEKSEAWFIQLWNHTIIPFLSDLIKEKLSLSSSETSNVLDFEEPTDTILNKYPWSTNSNTVSIRERLSRLKIDKDHLNDLSQTTSDIGSTTSKNNHRLFSMLMRLQQTTANNVPNPREDQLSSGFYESSASSSPKSSTSPISLTTGVFSINMKQKIESSL